MSIFSDYECGALTDEEFEMSCVEMNAEDRYDSFYLDDNVVNVAFITEDNTIEFDFMEEDGLDNVSAINTEKVVGYVIIDGYEDADDEEILDAFKKGFKNFRDYFKEVK